MYSFVVLGEVPGTNIIISFSTWLVVGLVTLLAVLAFRTLARKHENSNEKRRISFIEKITI